MADVEQQFIDEYLGTRKRAKAETKQRQVYREMLKARQFQATTSSPSDIVAFYQQDADKRNLQDLEPADRFKVLAEDVYAKRRSQFVTDYEKAYFDYKEEIPFDWWMQWDPNDLRLFGDAGLDGRAQEIEDAQWNMSHEKGYQESLDRRVEQIVENQDRGRNFGMKVLNFLDLSGFERKPEAADREAIRRELELFDRGELDTLFEEDLAEWRDTQVGWMREQMLQARDIERTQMSLLEGTDQYAEPRTDEEIDQQIQDTLDERLVDMRNQINQGIDPSEVLGGKALTSTFVEGGIAGLGWIIDKVVRGGTGILQGAEYIGTAGNQWNGPMQALKDKSLEKQQELISEIQNQWTNVGEDFAKEASLPAVRSAWDQMATENPEAQQEYVRMAGFDPILAFSMFAADVQDAPQAQEQMEAYVEALREADKDRIQFLQDKDFRASDTVMDGMAWWGDKINRAGAFYMTLVSDEDIWNNFNIDTLSEFRDDVRATMARGGDTPSGVLGIDGSLAGLSLDLGLGIVLDPATWLFGPRGSLRSVKAFTMAQVDNLAKHPMVNRFMIDAALAARSPSRGAASLMHHLGWLDDVARGEFLAEIGFKPQTLVASPWRKTKAAAETMEIRTDFVGKVHTTKAAGYTKAMADDLTAKGFNEPLEVSLSRATGEIKLSDGAKRFEWALDNDITHVPVRLKVVDDFGDASRSIWSELAMGKGMKVSKEALDRTTQAEVLAQTQLLRDSGLKAKSLGKLDGMDVKSIVSGGEVRYWLEGADGSIQAAIAPSSSGGGSFAVAAGGEGGGLMGRFMDHLGDPDLVMQLSKSESVSQSAASFFQKYASAKMADELAPSVGTKLDDLVKADDLSLRRPVAEYGSGEVFARPDQIIPREMLLGKFNETKLRQIAADSIARGATPDGAKRSVISVAWNKMVRDQLKNSRAGDWIVRYMSPQNTINRFDLVGPGSTERLYDTIHRVWGSDNVKANQWTEALIEYETRIASKNKAAVNRLSALKPLKAELRAFEDFTGGGWDDSLKHYEQLHGKPGIDVEQQALNLEQARALGQRADIQQMKVDLTKQFDRMYADAHKAATDLGDTSVLAKIVEDMWDDYNRTYIATNKGWAKHVDPETGMVPWDLLKKGQKKPAVREPVEAGARTFISEDMTKMANELGVDAEALMKKLSNSANMQMAVHTPLSPLELLMAAETSGAKWTRLTHQKSVATLREAAFTFNRLWVVDKVFRMSTAVTVSFDELLRIWHIGGPEAAMRWMGDRATFMNARAQSVLHGGKPTVSAGARYLSPKAQERIRTLGDFQTHLKQAERQFYDANGLGWSDIKPKDPGYREAAQRWTGGMLQDSGFRAYLRGPQAFDEWFFSNDGARLREASVMAKDATGGWGTQVMKGSEEAYQGWQTLFEKVILSDAQKAGKFDDVMQAFRETAAKIEEAGGQRAFELPGYVFDNLGPVRGVKKNLPGTAVATKMQDAFFDKLFMDPVNYRRGFLSEMVRKSERSRIEQLFANQGKRIMSDLEIERVLGLEGFGGATRVGMKGVFQEMAVKAGYVPESMISDLVERAVMKEVDNVLYTWDKGSRMGQQGKAVFPFGRPWADMMGFWGREIVRKPAMRGMINEKNFLGLQALERLPLNPKPAAMMSRLAATDFTIDHGLLGGAFGTQRAEGGLLPGSESSDISPLFFLPTGGENPFGSLIPGLGYIPMAALDMVMDRLVDPVEDPEGYQTLVDQISDFLPTVRYQQGGIISKTLGGGSAGSLLGMAVDGLGLGGKSADTWFNFTSELGDISREVGRTREVSSLLADPEELDLLLEAKTPEEVEMLLQGLAAQADKNASGSHLAKTATRWVAPVSNKFDNTISDIWDVWVEASGTFPELQVRPSLQDADLNDPEVRRQYANDVRGAFFDLPQWKRDLLVSQQPSLAVNLVSSWEWTPAATAANLPDTDKTYRTGGTNEALARHQYYIEQGYVRPLQPIERARRIVGMMFAAKESAAKEVYVQAASQINEVIWTSVVDDQTKVFLDSVAASDFGKRWDIRTGAEMWENWGSLEEEFERWYAGEVGIEPVRGDAAWDELRAKISVPTKEKPWGKSWPGIDADEVSAKFGGIRFNSFDENIIELAEGLGIDLTTGMTGAQLYNGIQEVITEVESPLFSTVRAAYDTYTTVRSKPAESARQELNKAANHPDLAPEWKQSMTEFLTYADRIKERYFEEVGGVPLSEQQTVVDKFMGLQHTSNLPLNWDKIWEDRYARSYGPLEWTPPEPLAPTREDGTIHPNAIAPYIKTIVDGDSLIVQEERGSQSYFAVRLLGVRAADFGSDTDGALDDKERLTDALQDARRNGDTIWLVRDPDTFGSSTDHYGRMLAWLWIGDKPFYFEDDFRRQQTPPGGER